MSNVTHAADAIAAAAVVDAAKHVQQDNHAPTNMGQHDDLQNHAARHLCVCHCTHGIPSTTSKPQIVQVPQQKHEHTTAPGKRQPTITIMHGM